MRWERASYQDATPTGLGYALGNGFLPRCHPYGAGLCAGNGIPTKMPPLRGWAMRWGTGLYQDATPTGLGLFRAKAESVIVAENPTLKHGVKRRLATSPNRAERPAQKTLTPSFRAE
ncbi:MAG: hypothetical protein J0L94_09450 [Rhodothermia bacterium]|nr:hypothetical protein [Rhodothermia bacterium]